MRSSKSRSRGNKSRNTRPSGGNIINRVFDSSGPEGKVRGTPQQIIEKYNQLHRDAQLSNDRVNSENFAQHAEHYTRIVAEAQREIDRQRDEQEAQNRDRQAERDKQAERDRERQQRLRSQEEANAKNNAEPTADNTGRETPAANTAPVSGDQPHQERRQPRRRPREEPKAAADPGSSEQPDVNLDIQNVGFLQPGDAGDSTLVETPEEKQAEPVAKRAPRPRKPRAPKVAVSESPADTPAEPPADPPTEAAE